MGSVCVYEFVYVYLSVLVYSETAKFHDMWLFAFVIFPFIFFKVQIRPWTLSDSDFVMDGSQPLDPRKTIFVGGVPRPLRAGQWSCWEIYHVFQTLTNVSCKTVGLTCSWNQKTKGSHENGVLPRLMASKPWFWFLVKLILNVAQGRWQQRSIRNMECLNLCSYCLWHYSVAGKNLWNWFDSKFPCVLNWLCCWKEKCVNVRLVTLVLDPGIQLQYGSVPVELAMIMDRLYGGVCYAGIDTDPELKYPKGAGRVAFSNQQSYIAAISARFVQLQHGDIDKRVNGFL